MVEGSMRAGRRILIVDDDVALRQSLAEQLELHAEFASVECGTAATALEVVGRERFDAVLLDIGLPDMDGRELCRAMRQAGVTAPIVMLTAADSEADTVLGLDAGANDYVTKPFRLSVLLARLRAHLRQSEHSDEAVLTIGPYTFRPRRQADERSGAAQEGAADRKGNGDPQIPLPRRDRAIGRDTLLGEVWGYNAGVATHTLETYVYRLRQQDRARPGERRNPRHRARRLSPAAVR